MPLALLTIPCRDDNYAFLITNTVTNEAALIDVPDAAPINAAIEKSGASLKTVLLTHHHYDHVDGLNDLNRTPETRVVGAKADAHRLPDLDLAVSEGDVFEICGETCNVIDVSGHTIGHIAFHTPESGYAFTADSLMAMGCGRLFEGTPAQMWQSMLKLRALPPETVICSGHEYTASNAKFAASLESDNAAVNARIQSVKDARAAGIATVPSLLSLEMATNPFLRADDPVMQEAIAMQGADATTVFAEIRARKDKF